MRGTIHTACGEGNSMNSFKPVRLLAALAVLTCWNAQPVHADGVTGTIDGGQTVTGNITGSGSDSFSFKVAAGVTFVASLGETGNHDTHFVPKIDLVPPGSGEGRGVAHPLNARLEEINAAGGTWTIKVSQAKEGYATGGAYALTLLQTPGATGTAMTAGKTYSGSNVRGKVDVYTFDGVAGHTATLTLSPTGGNGFYPESYIFEPTGGLAGGVGCAASCQKDVPLKASGTYTVMVWKVDGVDVTGAYSLSVNDKN